MNPGQSAILDEPDFQLVIGRVGDHVEGAASVREKDVDRFTRSWAGNGWTVETAGENPERPGCLKVHLSRERI